jgi:hypothetical protein
LAEGSVLESMLLSIEDQSILLSSSSFGTGERYSLRWRREVLTDADGEWEGAYYDPCTEG